MTMKFLVASAAALTIGVATTASAQDADDRPFDGIYVGVSGGYDIQGNDVGSRIQFDRNNDGIFGMGATDEVRTAAGANAFSPGFCNGRAFTGNSAQGCENDRNRAAYYGRVGFDKQFGDHLLFGAVGEFGKTEIKDYVSGFSTTPASYTFERGIRWEASARLRAGAVFGSGTRASSGVFYATGGVGYADIRHRFLTTNTANAFSGNGNKKEFGFVVGGGLEKFLTKNISFGLEYTYHDYKDNAFRVTATQGTAPTTNPFVLAPNTSTIFRRSDPDFRWHSLRGTLNFRL